MAGSPQVCYKRQQTHAACRSALSAGRYADVPATIEAKQMLSTSRHFASVIVVAAAALGDAASAQEQQHPLEPVDRSSPRATLNGFIDACNKIYQVIQQTVLIGLWQRYTWWHSSGKVTTSGRFSRHLQV